MERLNIQRKHRKRNTEIRKTTKIIDALEHSLKLKWKWAGHIARMDREKWTHKVTTWQGPTNKRQRGRPREKWVNEFQLTTAAVIPPKEAIMSLVAQAFQASKIVPDVIPTAPEATIELKYPSGAVASQGNELTPTQVKNQPSVSYKADPAAYYTLVFTDPDNYNTTEPVYREWHHWLVGNIPGNKVSQGEVLSGYIGSGPPEGTGIHRYVFILYKQPGKINFDGTRLTNKSIDGRAAFSTKKFAEKYNLGAPVAGNFYRAQFDDYVPQLYKSLGV
ncbi:unnamed protein product [Chilo suppressalis]|uniref:Uncharacterized protein n=1 Tax=Chilo suppressalis TaxID=168631 RepID=A0ABN8B2Y3_CHISP|nr:hypothetical protein evm_001398 [Chilo suppressalis]CAH0402668.1 unnamed protein product [Chilo suppressalis]